MIARMLPAAAAAVLTAIVGSAPPHRAAPAPSPHFQNTLAISPASARVLAGATIDFHAFGSSAESVRWSVIGAGTITADGVYRAPSALGASVRIVATGGGRAVAAPVVISGPPARSTPLAVVSCYDDGQIEVRNAATLSEIGSAAGGDRGAGVAIDPTGRVAVIADGDRLEALDLSDATFSLSDEIAGARFSELAFLGGDVVAATDNEAEAGAPGVRFFRVTLGSPPRLLGDARAGDTPEGIVVSQDERTFYVSNVNGDSVERFQYDGAGDARMTGEADTGHRPFGIAVDDVRRLLFVADNDTPTISGAASAPGLEVFSLPSLRRVARVTTGSADALPLGVAVAPAVNRVFVSNEGDGDVVAYSIVPLRRLGVAPAGRAPWLPTIDAARGRLFVPSALGDAFSVFDVRTLKPVAALVPTCGYPTSIGIADRS